MAGSQSLVCITDTFTFTTSATTTTVTPGLVVATVSSFGSFPVVTKESVAGPSCSFSVGSFYSTRQRTPVLAKRAWVEPPQKTPEITPLDFFQLYFMPVLVDKIVQQTNAYAYIEVTKEN